VLTTWDGSEGEACDYFLFEAGGTGTEPLTLLALVSAHLALFPSITSVLDLEILT
jgi:hypothetical protein